MSKVEYCTLLEKGRRKSATISHALLSFVEYVI